MSWFLQDLVWLFLRIQFRFPHYHRYICRNVVSSQLPDYGILEVDCRVRRAGECFRSERQYNQLQGFDAFTLRVLFFV